MLNSNQRATSLCRSFAMTATSTYNPIVIAIPANTANITNMVIVPTIVLYSKYCYLIFDRKGTHKLSKTSRKEKRFL